MPSASASDVPGRDADAAVAALDQLAQLVARRADRRHPDPEAVEQPRAEGEVGFEVIEVRREQAVGVHQPRRALGVGHLAVVEEHQAVERAEPVRERVRGARLARLGAVGEGAAREHEHEADAWIALGGLDRRLDRGDRVQPVPDAAVPQHDLVLLADPGQTRPRSRPLDALRRLRRDPERHLVDERAERGVGRVGGGTDQARGEQRAEVEVALAPAAADEVMAAVRAPRGSGRAPRCSTAAGARARTTPAPRGCRAGADRRGRRRRGRPTRAASPPPAGRAGA